MIKIKNILFFLISVLVLIMIFLNYPILQDRLKDILRIHPDLVIEPGNAYTKENSFLFVSPLEEYTPYDYEDLKKMFYSIFNQGWSEFTFYCPIEYRNCLTDVATLSNDEILLSNINNYVHPYNSYASIKTLYDDTGEVTVKIQHLYSDEEIAKIDKELDSILATQVNASMSDRDKILALHDYIIRTTKYDPYKTDKDDLSKSSSPYDSSRILGVLYDHYAICSGYTDTMAVLLEKLKIPNYKIASATHVWNAVYLEGKWWHLDLTWDDPITTSGKDILDHSYFLITNEELLDLDEGIDDHLFDKKVYLEFQ